MWDLLQDIIIDSLKTLPFLFAAYMLIEYIEHKASGKLVNFLKKGKTCGPAFGALLGCVPQCGFSVAAANLYAGKLISLGTLIAVFLSTSDEAIPILIANPDNLPLLWRLILIKLAVGAAAGFSVDLIIRVIGHGKTAEISNIEHDEDCDKDGVILSALKHTFEIFLFILLINAVMSLAIYYIGEDRISALMLSGSVYQPFLTAIIGFIPNCAASVILTELFITNAVSYGALVSGLLTGAGIGLAVLLKMNKNFKENLFIVAVLYVFAVCTGVVVNLFV